MRFYSILVLFISLTISSCIGQPSKNIENTSPEAFAKKISEVPNAQILDVRTPEEYAPEHIDNAENADWLGNNFVSDIAIYDKSKPVFVYCKSGGRSVKAAAKLQELGFKKIYNLEGGFLKWTSAGLSKPDDTIIGMSSLAYSKLIHSHKKVLIDFYAEWCAPCKKMTPYLLQMQKEMAGKVVIIRLNADENKTLMKDMKIDELPTLLLYENQEINWKHSGFISEEDLKKQL
ncbi:thioredoxin domain-containing protein [Flavobacterium cellulosilyticum]|uniref:Redoxin domain-containing protein n=1 Tax=Flavobacterium cellulosilyticum TaxID=2541731 RepID=A0A4R5CAJ9_9FLAO|nr:thioredoxin domain-containing protein [Flavobacterium cellulosilyticum]TDD95220.1 redoxin domain-containing protein [Flavobacterium cellulosilyticum]